LHVPRARSTELGPLVAGIGIALIGVLALLDSGDVLDLSFAVLAPVACAVIGATLLALGLTRRD
jgi:hypothetical protein